MKTKETFEFELPIHIGDKVWLPESRSFGSCNFLERYTKYHEYTVSNVYIRFNLASNSQEICFSVEGEEGHCYVYNDKTAFSKEQLYEQLRDEIETLVPEDMRNYLWGNNNNEYFKITDAIKVLRKSFGKMENSSTFNDSLRNAIEALEDVKKYY